jgi:hypothetical protein
MKMIYYIYKYVTIALNSVAAGLCLKYGLVLFALIHLGLIYFIINTKLPAWLDEEKK